MALPPIPRYYDATLSLTELEHDMRFQEIGFKGITQIATEGGKTVAIHSRGPNVPLNSLELKEDANGSATGSPGSSPICQGKAFIGGTEKKVAAFRKAPAGAASGTPAAGGAPPAAGAGGAGGTPAGPPAPTEGGGSGGGGDPTGYQGDGED